MSSAFGVKRPIWFWAVAALLLLWQLGGCFAFYRYAIVGPDDAYLRHLNDLTPAWYWWVFAVAAIAGTLSALALLARSRFAKPLALVSLIAVILQYSYILWTTDLIAHDGLAGAAGLPVTIAVLGVFQLWFAKLAVKRGWIS